MKISEVALATVLLIGVTGNAGAQAPLACSGAGPQTPRDITKKAGLNEARFALAPASTKMNLCNIHFHTNAEHKGPGFSVSAGGGEHGGWKCNGTSKLTAAELKPSKGSACEGLKSGDTIEVHWVYSSCGVKPGKGLGSCLAAGCNDPVLRVETQVFVAVNSRKALNFAAFNYRGAARKGRHQPRTLPGKTGKPIVFRGSTTGPSYNSGDKCSPMKVTWSVRPNCAKVDIETVHKWCKSNVFHEHHAHGVRQLVSDPKFLDMIN